jgi:hypothetical protein
MVELVVSEVKSPAEIVRLELGVPGVNRSPTATTFKLVKYTTVSPLVCALPKCMSWASTPPNHNV